MALFEQMVHSLCRASSLVCSFCLRVGFRVGVSGGGVDGRGLSVLEGSSVMESVEVVSGRCECDGVVVLSRCD